jgi:N4-(beta-N-acetylglucosaminyl)-L-asparaginase
MSSTRSNRRDFVRATANVGLAAATPIASATTTIGAPAIRRARCDRWSSPTRAGSSSRTAALSARSNAPSPHHRRQDVLDALIAGVNIPELDPEETGIGGALPNADGVVQLDASCMHRPNAERAAS